MSGLRRFLPGFNSSNTVVDGDCNTSIPSQEMQKYSEADVAEEATEADLCRINEGRHDVRTTNLLDDGFKESSVDGVDSAGDNHFQNEHTYDSIGEPQSGEETPPQVQDVAVVLSGHGVGQSVDKLTRDFEKAVSTGDLGKSTAILKLFVKHQAKLKIKLLSIGSPDNEPFNINVNVETYKVAKGPKWKMQVTPSLTIFALKLKTCLLYGLPLSNQRWIIGKDMPHDTKTLRDCGVCDNAEVFLYLTAPQGVDPKEEMALVEGFHQQLMLRGVGNEELSFTQAEYNKYLKEAKLRQDSSQTDQAENGFQPNQPTNMQPQAQAPLPWNGRQHNVVQPLEEPTDTHEELQFLDDFYDTPRYFMGGDFKRNQTTAGATADTPTNRVGNGGTFPPPHLVQRGPPVHVTQKKQNVLPKCQPHLKDNFKKVVRRYEQPPVNKQDVQKGRVRRMGMSRSMRQPATDSRQTGSDMTVGPRYDEMHLLQAKKATKRDLQSGRRRVATPKIVRPLDLKAKTTEDIYHPFYNGSPTIDPNPYFKFKPLDVQPERRPVARASRRLPRGSPVLVFPNDDDPSTQPRRHSLPSALDVGWECPACTVVNPPQIPGCRVCLQDRPDEYEVPDYGSYIMDKDEARHVTELEKNEQKLVEMQLKEENKQKFMAQQNRMELLQAAEYNVTTNEKPFECPICFSEIEPGQGVRLQECLHEICSDCCANHINISNEAEVQCPFTDGENDCQQAITDREILQIVGQAKYDEYKTRSLKSAEAKSANTFHCLTPNCEGFCFYDEQHNFFDCPICRRMSCLTCKVIHEGQNCREYQDDIKRKAANDETARQTQEQLQRLLQQGMAMNCPQCGVVIQKKGGCPNMTCSVCRRGFRWTGIDM